MQRADLEEIWYGPKPPPIHWRLLSGIYGLVVSARRGLYDSGFFSSDRPDCPVIVVGNITAGGTGKTPLVLWITEALQSAGLRPGVVSRGYGGTHRKGVLEVGSDTDPAVAGDEPVLVARHSGLPVAVSRDRAAAARYLADRVGVNVVVADDGLQHYALGRDVEICVIDGGRRLGNGRLLPAGPLREPPERMDEVDFVVANGEAREGEIHMEQTIADAVSLETGERRSLSAFRRQRAHAVAGVGNPRRFFAALEAVGLNLQAHPFPDHHVFERDDFSFGDGGAVLMTEKDAVKCRGLDLRNAWYVPVAVQMPHTFRKRLLEMVEAAKTGNPPGR